MLPAPAACAHRSLPQHGSSSGPGPLPPLSAFPSASLGETRTPWPGCRAAPSAHACGSVPSIPRPPLPQTPEPRPASHVTVLAPPYARLTWQPSTFWSFSRAPGKASLPPPSSTWPCTRDCGWGWPRGPLVGSNAPRARPRSPLFCGCLSPACGYGSSPREVK